MKFRLKKIICILLFTFGATTNAIAKNSGWEVSLAPYLWAIGMNGDVQVEYQSATMHESFSDLIKNFRGGGMVWFDVKKDRFGAFINGLYVSLGQNSDINTATIKITSDYSLFSAGFSYRWFNVFEPYIGARYTNTSSTISVLNTNIAASNNISWTDPIIGARLLLNSKCHWSGFIAADVGGTNFNDHNSYDFNAFIGYNPSLKSKLFTLYLGYRLLYQHYVTGTGTSYFAWKMHLSGPVLGFALRF